MLKILIGILFIGVLVSLFSGLFFLVKDGNDSKRLANSLSVRVGLAAAILIIIVIALYTGDLQLNQSPV